MQGFPKTWVASIADVSEVMAELSKDVSLNKEMLRITEQVSSQIWAKIQSTYHDVQIERSGGAYELTLANGPVPMDRDFELTWQPIASAAPQAANR